LITDIHFHRKIGNSVYEFKEYSTKKEKTQERKKLEQHKFPKTICNPQIPVKCQSKLSMTLTYNI